MDAFEIRAATKDMTSDSKLIIRTEEGEMFDVVAIKRECSQIKDVETGKIKEIYPCNLVVVVKSRKTPEKVARTKIKGSGV
jgi:hypothetical protein